MIQLNIPVGISEFSEIRQREYYYVDKTGLIREMLERPLAKVTLITRPRRWMDESVSCDLLFLEGC